MSVKPFFVIQRIDPQTARKTAEAFTKVSLEPHQVIMTSTSFIVIGVLWDDTSAKLWDALAKAGAFQSATDVLIVPASRDTAWARDKPASRWLSKHVWSRPAGNES